MLKIIFLIAFFILKIICFAQQSEFLWAKKLGGPFAFNSSGRSIVADDAGNIYLAGYFYNTVDFDPGPGTANLTANNLGGYLAKYDASGNYKWAFTIGKYAYTVLHDDSLNIYVSGIFYGKKDFDPGQDTAYLTSLTDHDGFIAKYSSDGDYLWAKRLAGGYGINTNYRKSIAIDKSGNVFIAGSFEDTAYFNNLPDSNYLVSNGRVNAFFAKYDNNGNVLWIRSIKGTDSSVSHIPGIATDAVGNCYITGRINPNINNDFDPGPDTAYLMTTGTYDDGFLAKYDMDGKYVWAFAIDAVQVHSFSISTDLHDDIYIAGSIIGDADFDPDSGIANLNPIGFYYTPFFAKYNSEGNYLFAKKITSYGTDEIYNITVDSSGKIAVAGYFTDSFADFDPGPDTVNLIFQFSNSDPYDAFWAIYDSSGNYLLAQSMYGNRKNIACDIFLNKNTLLVTGNFDDTTYFDNDNTEYIVSEGIVSNTDNSFFAKYQLDFTNGENSINSNAKPITIFPNPTTGKFQLTTNNGQRATISIYNVLGEVVYALIPSFGHPSPAGEGTGEREIDLSSQPQGIYFVKIQTGENIFAEKIVKF